MFKIQNTDDIILNFTAEQITITQQLISCLEEINSTILQDDLLKNITFDIMIAGGAVRDLILGKYQQIKDIDLLFSAKLSI
jgi:tRNA nucleotidyltransferase/poly(A) polymerase